MSSAKQYYLRTAACAAALLAVSPAWAQSSQTTSEPDVASQPDTASQPEAASEGDIVVTGIRASQQRAINVKRRYDSTVEVISAEDIGKMPDKNVADALQKLPGVTTLTGSGGQGGYDENDRVAIRGTTASLTLVTLNGHSMATADWDPADQIAGGAGSAGSGAARSVSFLLLPSEIVSQAIVHKSPQAKDVDGGLAGSIDIITRRPLDFKEPLTAQLNVQGVYSDRAKKADPQISGLVNWQNKDGTFGVMLQGFLEQRHIRRDGQAELAWSQIPSNSVVGGAGRPDLTKPAGPGNAGPLADKYYISASTETLFRQKRKRLGGVAALEWKPSDQLTFNLDGFYSKLDASYINNRVVIRPGNSIIGGVVPTGTTVDSEGRITSAIFNNTGNAMGAQLETLANPDSSSRTAYVNFNVKYEPTDNVHITAQGGRTSAVGESYLYWNYIFLPNVATAYNYNGNGDPVSFAFPNGIKATDLSYKTGNSGQDNSYSLQRSTDKETYGQFDTTFDIADSVLNAVDIGFRYAKHVRTGSRPNKGGPPENAAKNGQDVLTTIPSWNGNVFPSNFGNGIGGVGSIGGMVPQIGSDDIVEWSKANLSDDASSNFNLPVSGVFRVGEKTVAGYIMGRFSGSRWRGNLGVRVVKTDTSVTTNTGVPCGVPTATNGVTFGDPQQAILCAGFVPAGTTLITGSRFGNFYVKTTDSNYVKALPSMNFAYDVTDQVMFRVGVGRVIARPDYSALGATISGFGYNPTATPVSTASGGNATLAPNDAWSYSAGIEWYPGRNSLIAVQLFYLDFKSLIGAGTSVQNLYNTAITLSQGGPAIIPTVVSSPISTTGYSRGVEVNFEQPLLWGFGVQANATVLKAKEDSGLDMLGASKLSYSAVGYYENHGLSARVAWSYRSKMRTGLYGISQNYMAGNGSLSAAINYDITKNVTLSLEGLNLNNPRLRYYNSASSAIPFDATTAFYNSGRQLYFGVRFKY